MGERRHLMARIEPIARPLAIAGAAFLLCALQSFLTVSHTPEAVLAAPLGLPFAAGLLLRWRAVLPTAAGTAAWVAVAAPADGWLVLPAVVAESAVAAWCAGRPVAGGVAAGRGGLVAATLAAAGRGGLVAATLAAAGRGGWPAALAATLVFDLLANVVLGRLAVTCVGRRSPGDEDRMRLLESAVVHARDAIIVLEAESTGGLGRSVLYVNEAFTRMTGYAAAEVVGRSLHFLRGPRSDPATLERLKGALAAGTPLQAELLNYRKDGSELWVELSLVPVTDPAGRCRHWVMIQRDVSDRKRAEEELRDREHRLRALGDNLPDGAVYQLTIGPDATARFTHVSAGVERLTGLSPEAVTADPTALYRLIHPDDLARVRTAERAAFAGRAPFDCEFRTYTTAGEVRWIHCRSRPTPLPDGSVTWHGVMIDVTAARQAAEAVRRSEELFRGLFENAAAGVAVTDAAGVFVSVNPAFAGMLGRPVAEVVGRSPQDFTHPADWAEQLPLVREVAAGTREGYQVRKRYLRPDGGIVWGELSVAIVRGPAGEYVYGIGVVVDVTERRQLEEQLRHVQKMEAIGQMAGGIAHDFNNLLTGVIGNLALVALPPGDPNADAVAAAETAANRAAELTRKLLGFARKNQLLVAPIRVGEFAREVVDILGRTVDPRIRIVTHLAAPDPVLADRTLLEQALLNLCLNARDAMPDGGTLTIRAAAVQVAPGEVRHPDARPGSYVRLTVADTGVGMTPEVKAHIFEPFFTTKPIGQGTGLGLPMVHGIVRQHGGWIECDTAPGRGSRFDLYLPRAAAPAPTQTPPNGVTPRPADRPADRPATPPDVATPPPDGSKTVLLVDDEDMIRHLGRSVLEAAGYKVLEAHDGAAAVDLFRREHDRIDLVILDLTMPRLSGRDAFRSMTAIAPDARVLFSSGYSADDMFDVSGAVGLLAKPYRPQDLVTAVRRALGTRPAVATPAG
jgi:two-component system cell cycle sensor histidine kinase/response regulator CckA